MAKGRTLKRLLKKMWTVVVVLAVVVRTKGSWQQHGISQLADE
jgi:hypothetical protein